ncbi:MAG: hypothetical protein LiPW15_342 [Parcubacteria group bacterium LiPW_15]|nr:MAG: hypothetical protein LiPW15_342 [Parcubacteria group bacterium LiPW_15]
MKKIIVFAVLFASIGSFGTLSAYAMTPTLSMSSTSGDSVQINVVGDANSGVMFYYNIGSSSGMQVTTLGTTNSSGTFTTTISGAAYGVNSGSSVYVLVNSQQSAMQTWPYNSSSLGTPSLSQTNVPVGLGQTVTVTSQGNTTGVYAGLSPNSTIALLQINGTQISITGRQIGSTNATICYVGTASNCANLAINVQSANVQSLSFSQNNVTLTTGQNTTINLYGGSGYYVASNSNSSVATPSINGSVLTIYGAANGSTNVNVCSSSGGCGIIYVTVNTSGTNQSISFGSTNPTISIGQSMSVPIYGGYNYYYISSNSNSGVAQANLSGSTLSLYGSSAGSTSIAICASSGTCSTLYVTVSGTTGGTTSNMTLLAEITAMQSQLAQILVSIQTMAAKLTQLAASAGGSTSGGGTTQIKYKFTLFLAVGSSGNEVTELQKRLISEGYFSGSTTGYYGTATEAAVKKYQSAHGVTAAGYVGPSTRVILNGE